MIRLKFDKPSEKYADNDFSGGKYEFSYTIEYVKSGTEVDDEAKHKVIVSASNILLRRWNFQNEEDLLKIFFLFVFQLIQTRLIEDTLNEVENLSLQTNTPNTDVKFDPQKIGDFVGEIYDIDLDDKRDRNRIKMGFQPPNEEQK